MPALTVGGYLSDKLIADGGTVLRGIPRWIALNTTERQDGDDSLDATLPSTFDAETWLPLSQCLQLRRENGAIEEWPILTWDRTRPSGVITLTAAPPRILLKRQSLIVVEAGDDVLLTATAIGLTAAQIIDTYLLPRMPSWVVRGTVEPTWPIPQWTVSGGNGLQAILALVDAINGSRIGPSDPLSYFFFERQSSTQWALSIRYSFSDTPITAGLAKNMGSILVGQSQINRITQLLPTDGNGLTTASCWFVITAISGSDVTLASWDDAADGVPIGFDDQLDGDYIVEADGVTCHAITASVAATQTVTVSSATGLSVGDRVGLARDSSGKRKVVWTDPGNVFTSADYLTVTDSVSRINWIRNAKFDNWTAGLPDDWTHADVGWGTAGTITQETNTTNIEQPPGVFAVKQLASAQGKPDAAIQQTWPMPWAVRNHVWTVRVRVFFPTGYPYSLYLGIQTARGWSWQIFSISDVPLTNYQWFTLTVDESAETLGAWTAGVRICGFNGGNAGLPLYIERCEFVDGDGTDSIDVTFGCGPNRLIHAANLELQATRDAASSYSINVIDRARQNLARYPNDVILPGRRLRPIMGTLDQSLPILQVDTDELHPTQTKVQLSSEVPRFTTQSSGGGSVSSLTGTGGTIGTVPVVNSTTATDNTPVLPGFGVKGPGTTIALSQLYSADAGIGLANNNPVPLWADQSGNGLDLTASGSARPTFFSDDGDGLPYVKFDGSAMGMGVTGMTAYTGTELTAFIVARAAIGTGTRTILSLGDPSHNDTSGPSVAKLPADTPSGMRTRRDGIEYGVDLPGGTPSGTSPVSGGVGVWSIFAARWKMIDGRGLVTLFNNGLSVSYDLGSSLPAFSYTWLFVGSGFDGSSRREFTPCAIRQVGIYQQALRDDQIRDLMRYVGSHWRIPIVGG
ncbi:MAG TPA: hypothetical protein VGM20_04330 [Gemmatimonadales bacterium]|jgi:hypothetical protein